jgi:hypothetical protein
LPFMKAVFEWATILRPSSTLFIFHSILFRAHGEGQLGGCGSTRPLSPPTAAPPSGLLTFTKPTTEKNLLSQPQIYCVIRKMYQVLLMDNLPHCVLPHWPKIKTLYSVLPSTEDCVWNWGWTEDGCPLSKEFLCKRGRLVSGDDTKPELALQTDTPDSLLWRWPVGRHDCRESAGVIVLSPSPPTRDTTSDFNSGSDIKVWSNFLFSSVVMGAKVEHEEPHCRGRKKDN